ncbi:transposase [Streptomyces sp. NPDC059832]|uniref:transposase n=1 Tax=Streptomyces sp. NPDC059832 TaxID=3346966 RepID=UPI00364A740A
MGRDLAELLSRANELSAVQGRFLHRFSRLEPRESALGHIRGLMAPRERKNGRTPAEEAGHAGPDRIHRPLNRIEWDADGAPWATCLTTWSTTRRSGAVLIVDDTGSPKKGTGSAGVRRQYSGTAGRTENCQVGAFLACAAPLGRTPIDRRPYPPVSRTDDRERGRRLRQGPAL